MQTLSKDLPSSSAVLSGLTAACKASQLQPSLAHLLAWHLWEHAVAKGLTLSPAAQEVLWQTQSGQQLTCHLGVCTLYLVSACTVHQDYMLACLKVNGGL